MTRQASSNRFRCAIIGQGSLPIQCGEILLAQGHTLATVVALDGALQAWARQMDLPCAARVDELASLLGNDDIDFLFSISNPAIIPATVMTLPKRGAINYHDAPLPAYAGVNATSWALMNGESQHGITWHVMTEQIDGGEILAQRVLAIDPQETAVTLNGKCFEAAIATFAELIEDLAQDRAQPRPQTPAGRSYVGRHRRPAAGAVVDWRQPAERIDALWRGLQFGPYPNPLALPKIALGAEYFLIDKLERGDLVEAQPGMLLSCGGDGLQVATPTRAVILRKLLTIDGEPQPIPALVERLGLQAGDLLASLPAANAERLTEINRRFAKEETFWSSQLSDLQLLDLPLRAATTAQRQSAALHVAPLPLDADLHTFLAERGWTLSDFLATIFALYLSRISQNPSYDLSFAPHALAEALGDLAGFFSTHLPLRVHVDGQGSFANLYDAISTKIAAMRGHGSYARDLVVRDPALRPRTELQTFRQKSSAVVERSSLSGMDALAGHALSLYFCTSSATDPQALLVDGSGEIDAAMLERVAAQVQTLITAVMVAPTALTAQLPIITADEWTQLAAWNETTTTFAAEGCIHHLFEAQVERTPDAVALTFVGREGMGASLTYGELDAQANQLAHYLQSLGVGPDTLVGVCLERSNEMVVCFLAILKAGGAYLPLDPAYPAERLAFMLADAGTPLLLTQTSLLHAVPDPGAQVIAIDDLAFALTALPTARPSSAVTARHLAYVIYTSGSTGRPKGVMIEHSGLCNMAQAQVRIFGVQPGHRMIQFVSPSFDVAVSDLVTALCSGATLVMADKARLQIGPTLQETLAEAAITHGELPPAALATLDPDQLPLLRTVITGGEVCPADVVVRWSRGRTFFNVYGPTEATNANTFLDCSDYAPALPGQPPSIGRPIANKQIHILDEHLQPLPIGVPGHLHIGGVGLARGYVNRPDLTDERFILNPFGPGRLYKTGDLARWLPNGEIDFLGRIDNQVKLRGFRIELGEIESQLLEHRAVRQAAVMVREDQPGDRRLVAYVVTDPTQPPTPADLRTFLQPRLPDYMLPAAIVVLDHLPLNPNGKVDRKALPAPTQAQGSRQRIYMEPRSVEEFDLAALWEEVLGVQQIGIDENFFELGGNSILALRLVVKISEKFGKQFPMGTLLQYPTIVEFSPLLSRNPQPGEPVIERWASLLPLQPKGSRPPFYCITPSGHDGIYLYPLARALGEDQPFYALRLPSLSGRVPPPATVEEAATFYVNEIKKVQPHGPYHLGGHSYGGIVAFEVAQQFHKGGDEVGFLALFDCEPGDYALVKPLNVLNYILHFVNYFVNTYGRPGEKEIPIHREMTVEKLATLSPDDRIEWVYEVLRQTYAPQAENLDEVRGMLISAIAGFQVVYQPAEVARLPFSFFLAEKLKPEDAQRRIDYWSHMGYATFRTIPGDHESMFTDPAHRLVLSRELSAGLQATYDRASVQNIILPSSGVAAWIDS